ncbi:hypothetical protein TPHA_0G00095 [Tetrapisispora phaffii CBS 4417]|uniref:Uncharacterized protein n=1 Tax=Tetrapisispora phaffii (strain ATCC 24235 / CBS 4417 / NBRC 1672 / NRRL Y-8282 / UCD 70-5) TaxID=1071381 RepID=G8BWR6_TETPH|nr:hypothetical protein TPHA_0G00095 [Tetrapisispora phaffii CBS 4417]CCE64220.1 hypothetical protein TPHA_0G00095 [Tetrapisispora phaffii CBS 4417]
MVEVKKKKLVLILFAVAQILILVTIFRSSDSVYNSVTSAVGYYRTSPVVNNTGEYIGKKIAYVSRHPGTTQDFKYIEENLQLENVDYFLHYGISMAERVINETQARYICSNYDTVVISDCLTDGWEFFRHDDLNCKNIVFVISNRYDVCAGGDREGFQQNFTHALNRDDGYEATIVANNAFEIPYLKYKNIELKRDYPIIRPFGNTDIESQDIAIEEPDIPCLIIDRFVSNQNILKNNIKNELNYDCKILKSKYGGPKTLSKYNSIVVHLPYQVSIMKMWENIAYGVLMAVPTPEFYDKICSENACAEPEHLSDVKKVATDGNWSKYVDFYLPEFEKCFTQFGSWKELGMILKTESYKNNINHCRNLMEDKRHASLKQWKELLKNLK